MMNDKILKLANALYNNEECKNQKFSLWLNGTEVITYKHLYDTMPSGYMISKGYIYPLLDEEGMKRITDELSKVDVKTFNITIEFEYGTDSGAERYLDGWYHCKITFWGERNKVKIAFDMLSSYCSFDHGAFDRSVGKLKVTEDKFSEYVQKIVELKNTLLDNGNRLLSKCREIKKF